MRVIFKEDNKLKAADPLFSVDIYSVYGIYFSKRYNLEYLLSDNSLPAANDTPNWYLAEYFDICDDKLPSSWHFRCYQDKKASFPLIAMWGYKELVECDRLEWPPRPDLPIEHYVGLIERYDDDLTLFRQRKQEMDEELGYIKKDPYDW